MLELQMFYHSIPPFFWRNFKEYAKNRKKQGKAINNTQNTQKEKIKALILDTVKKTSQKNRTQKNLKKKKI